MTRAVKTCVHCCLSPLRLLLLLRWCILLFFFRCSLCDSSFFFYLLIFLVSFFPSSLHLSALPSLLLLLPFLFLFASLFPHFSFLLFSFLSSFRPLIIPLMLYIADGDTNKSCILYPQLWRTSALLTGVMNHASDGHGWRAAAVDFHCRGGRGLGRLLVHS